MCRFAAAFLLFITALGGCAPTSAGGPSDGPSRNLDFITSEELRAEATESESAYQAIRRMRPAWLRPRGFAGDRVTPYVFFGNSRYGPIDSLRDFPVESVRTLEFINSRDATTRFGTGYPAGVIMVMGR